MVNGGGTAGVGLAILVGVLGTRNEPAKSEAVSSLCSSLSTLEVKNVPSSSSVSDAVSSATSSAQALASAAQSTASSVNCSVSKSS
jgi:hypothetical protein